MLIILACILYAASCFYFFGGSESRGQFGDMFGALSALFTGLAFALMVITLRMQRQELRMQREELQMTRTEIKGQKEELRMQRFETGFAPKLQLFIDHYMPVQKSVNEDMSLVMTILGETYEFFCDPDGKIDKSLSRVAFMDHINKEMHRNLLSPQYNNFDINNYKDVISTKPSIPNNLSIDKVQSFGYILTILVTGKLDKYVMLFDYYYYIFNHLKNSKLPKIEENEQFKFLIDIINNDLRMCFWFICQLDPVKWDKYREIKFALDSCWRTLNEDLGLSEGRWYFFKRIMADWDKSYPEHK